jgi:hypothetical protein
MDGRAPAQQRGVQAVKHHGDDHEQVALHEGHGQKRFQFPPQHDQAGADDAQQDAEHLAHRNFFAVEN